MEDRHAWANPCMHVKITRNNDVRFWSNESFSHSSTFRHVRVPNKELSKVNYPKSLTKSLSVELSSSKATIESLNIITRSANVQDVAKTLKSVLPKDTSVYVRLSDAF